jgi:hypothetical protein
MKQVNMAKYEKASGIKKANFWPANMAKANIIKELIAERVGSFIVATDGKL